MIFRSNDLALLFADFGVTVQFGGSTALGIFDQPEAIHLADQGFGGIQMVRPSLKLRYNAFNPMPENRQAIEVDGQSYTIAEHTTESDGAIITYSLKGPGL